MGPRHGQRESIMSEDSFYDADEGNEETVLRPEQHKRSPSLSKALARVRESIVGVNSQFECPVCFEEMKPPVHMFQCRQGHVVCQVLYWSIRHPYIFSFFFRTVETKVD